MEAIGFDTLNGNHKWRDSTKKELDSIDEYETFSYKGKAIYNNGTMANSPVGYKKIRVHLIFDIKHDGRHKARLVADGYLMEIPVESVYSGVVSIWSLRIVTFLVENNKLELWGADIGNTNLEARTKEKVLIVAGPEFGPRAGNVLIIHRALYGLELSGKWWSEKFWE